MAIPMPIAAWRLLDGTYALDTRRLYPEATMPPERDNPESLQGEICRAGGRWDDDVRDWVVPESALESLRAYRVYVVILANSCCGSVAAVQVRQSEKERGKAFRVYCPSCGRRCPTSTLWEFPIVEVCGEGEEGRLTYEAAFRSEVEG